MSARSKSLPRALYRVSDARALDRLAIEKAGIPAIDLMERAGKEAFVVLKERIAQPRRLAVFAGPGNNGGDGFVIARLAAESGFDLSLSMLCAPKSLAGAAAMAWERLKACPAYPRVRIRRLSKAADKRQREGDDSSILAEDIDLVVDTLFGTGLARALTGAAAKAVRAINDSPAPVLSVDIPSGLDADRGRVLRDEQGRGEAVKATLTLSLVVPKQGLFTCEGRELSGEIVHRDLGLRADSPSAPVVPSAYRHRFEDCVGVLPPRPLHAHKGDFGHVLIVGGDIGMAGAGRLAGAAALRCGAGLVTLATRSEHAPALVAAFPELMVKGVESPDELQPMIERAQVIAIGPGLGVGDWGHCLLERVSRSGRALVVDADALNLVAQDKSIEESMRKSETIVHTPHPKEAARLSGISTADVEADRFAAVCALVRERGGVWLLKGVGTLVAAKGETIRICEGGNPGMAVAGMGDVLTGVVAALLAQGLCGFEAASTAACLHAAAGDRAASEGRRGLIAGDLLHPLRQLVDRL
ncbi:bifunctional ADP-dependent NAD(P)H-hydrate dehydratase/NAD(P)H-hydrate epimerase [Thioalkalivibrio sp. HK1]|uniref:bifunctional ADP-dependent NAD(P)H-hydrate dehydratase/NAD(P)H-hydrate epimerase n=1 Tax=Thioalkalivibrio sp. HK1 TaxID=1469245 RepID=UPI000571B455|nr:bifunctional ADP-dependent NAD(P)H-hydrate dehydratase/NAD(P)H-hydrate epimerase [Thioalkalivibrio sp. HK1]